MLVRHISNADKTLLYFDVDCDGYSSGASMLNYLHQMFPAYTESIKYITNEGKKHGLILERIPEDIKFIIIPDAGSNDIEQCKELKERGVDVLILDHHEAQDPNPYACVINNQTCGYPNKTLCGAGIVYKFCQYIDQLMGTDYSDNILDLTALGLIGDVMDIRDYETRRLIDKGLARIRNPFFSAMVEKQSYSLGGEITPIGIAFYIVPFINAVVRMGEEEDKIGLFEALLDYRGNEIIPSTKRGCKGQMETRAEQACRNATNIKSHQQKARDEAVEIIESLIEEQHLNDNKILAIRLDKEHSINKNLTGLVANIIMGKYQKPTLVLSETELGWEGSARGLSNSQFDAFKDFLESSGLTAYDAGHQSAFGCGIETSNFDNLMSYCNEKLAAFDFSPCYKVDFIYQANTTQPQNILDIAFLNHLWGTGVDEPFIAIENVPVGDNVILMSPDKNPTMKITLSNGITMIKFKSSKEEVENLKGKGGLTNRINVVGRCAANIWNGNTTAQILIEDYEVVGSYYDF